MKNLKIETAHGVVTVVKTTKGLEYNLPKMMDGESFYQMKQKHKEEIELFKNGFVKSLPSELKVGDDFIFAPVPKKKKSFNVVVKISDDDFVIYRTFKNTLEVSEHKKLSRFGDPREIFICEKNVEKKKGVKRK